MAELLTGPLGTLHYGKGNERYARKDIDYLIHAISNIIPMTKCKREAGEMRNGVKCYVNYTNTTKQVGSQIWKRQGRRPARKSERGQGK